MMSTEEINKHLGVLKIQKDIANVNINEINNAFRKLAAVMHPDKAGDKSTADFQELLNSCHVLRNYFKETCETVSPENKDVDDDEKFFEDNFEKFNFPFENKGSFTVAIEDCLADTWQECIGNLLGDPRVVKNAWGTECDRIWKTEYSGIDITIHIYNNPKNKKGSKLMLQGGRQSLICTFVFEELPKIYKSVLKNKPREIEGNFKTKVTPSKPVVKCDQCKYKASMMQMKMHIKTLHAPSRPKRAAKRLQNFTPIVKTAKRSKSKQAQYSLISEGIADDNSFFLLDDSLCGKGPTLAELSASDIIIDKPVTQSAQQHSPVQIKPLFSCDKCEFDCEVEVNLNVHMKDSHEDTDCRDCAFTPDEDIVLKNHRKDCKMMPQIGTENIVSFSCDKCAFVSKTTRGLDRHIENFCTECNICLAENIEYEIHSNLHNECKSNQCNFAATSSFNLRDHVVEKHPKNKFPCTKCDLVLGYEKELMIHFNAKHRLITEEVVELVIPISSDEHNDVSIADEDTPSYICGQCGENFVNQNQCLKHMDSHLFKCYKCEYTCENMEELASHENTKHKLLRNHTTSGKEQQEIKEGNHHNSCMCEQCGEYFTAIPALQEHVCGEQEQRAHKLMNPCNQCNALFERPEDLNRHILLHNEPTLSTKCEQCSYACNDISMLEKHTRQKHRKPDSCQYCDYDAKDRGILQDHMIEVHEE